MPLETTVTQDPAGARQRVRYVCAPNTKADGSGSPAAVDGPVGVEFDDPTQPVTGVSVSQLEPAVRAPADFIGDVAGSLVADADLGAGVVRISERFLIHYVHPQAENLGASTAVVEPDPDPA